MKAVAILIRCVRKTPCPHQVRTPAGAGEFGYRPSAAAYEVVDSAVISGTPFDLPAETWVFDCSARRAGFARCEDGHPEQITNRPGRYPSIIHRAAGKITADQAEHRNVEVSPGDRVATSARG